VPLLRGDLGAALAAAAVGELAGVELEAASGAAVTVVVTAGEYPGGNDQGTAISGIEEAEAAGAIVFQAGTALHGERLVTNGGRILGVTGVGSSIAAARAAAYAGVSRIEIEDARYRTDIAAAAAGGKTFSLHG
jgi:phosphoribosylamine--glycine ligase